MLSSLTLRLQRLFGSKCGELSIAEAAGMVGKPGIFFFDVNSPARYAQGHVPGAKNLVADKLDVSGLPPDKKATLVFYCGGPM